MILNHVDGSRNRVESLAKSRIGNQMFTKFSLLFLLILVHVRKISSHDIYIYIYIIIYTIVWKIFVVENVRENNFRGLPIPTKIF